MNRFTWPVAPTASLPRPESRDQRLEREGVAYWKRQFDQQKTRADGLLAVLVRAEALLASVLDQHDLLPSPTLTAVREAITRAEGR